MTKNKYELTMDVMFLERRVADLERQLEDQTRGNIHEERSTFTGTVWSREPTLNAKVNAVLDHIGLNVEVDPPRSAEVKVSKVKKGKK